MNSSPYNKKNVIAGAVHYLIGRISAGLAGLAVVILLARLMKVNDYALYTAFSGLAAMIGVLAGLGMDRAISRYVPEARIEKDPKLLSLFIWQLTIVKVVITIVLLILAFLFWQQLNAMFQFAGATFFSIAFAIYVFSEVLFQHLSSVLQSLVMQKQLTRLMVIQWLGRLLGIGGMVLLDISIDWEIAFWIFAIPELMAALAAMFLVQFEMNKLSAITSAKYNDENWPQWSRVVDTAKNNYGFTLLAAPPQGYFMKILSALFLSSEYVAAYGFFVNLAEKFRQYLPLNFFYNLLEPVMIARYIKTKDFSDLGQKCELLYRSNLLIMAPVITIVALVGGELVDLITDHKYGSLNWILLLLLIQLTIGGHSMLLQLLLNAIERNRLLVSGSVFALIPMALFFIVIVYTQPKLLFISPVLFSISFNAYILKRLAGWQYRYQVNTHVVLKLVLFAIVIYVLVYSLLQLMSTTNISLQVLVALLTVMTLFSYCFWQFKILSGQEINAVRSLLKKG